MAATGLARAICASALTMGVLMCGADDGGEGASPGMASRLITAPASDGRLRIHLELGDGVELDRVPMRTLRLHFENLTDVPLRIYMPQSEPFRAGISSITMAPASAPPLFIPEPRPHGYVVTERDFPLLAPRETRTETQRFTIDPFPLRGREPARRAGFEPGSTVRVSWTYENRIDRWEGGRPTMDGPTRALFGGGPIPHIWTGRLQVSGEWTAPAQ